MIRMVRGCRCTNVAAQRKAASSVEFGWLRTAPRGSAKSILWAVAAFVALVAFATLPMPISAQQPAPRTIESFVLQSSDCRCQNYRIELDHDGRAVFESLNGEDAGRTEEARIDSTVVRRLWALALEIRFTELPDFLDRSSLCTVMATDAPHVTLTMTTSDTSKRVSDFSMCTETSPRLCGLRHLEQAIDSVGASQGWITKPVSGYFDQTRFAHGCR